MINLVEIGNGMPVCERATLRQRGFALLRGDASAEGQLPLGPSHRWDERAYVPGCLAGLSMSSLVRLTSLTISSTLSLIIVWSRVPNSSGGILPSSASL